MDILTKEGTSGLRKHKILRMASEALDQDGLLTQEDLAVLLCSSRRTIRRDIKELKQQGIDVPTRGLIQDIGPGVTHKSKIVKMWLEGYEYTDIERKQVILAFQSRDISQDFLNRSDSTSEATHYQKYAN